MRGEDKGGEEAEAEEEEEEAQLAWRKDASLCPSRRPKLDAEDVAESIGWEGSGAGEEEVKEATNHRHLLPIHDSF